MKKFIAIVAVLACIGAYAAPAFAMPQEVTTKVVTVDKNKKKATAVKKTAKTSSSCTEAASSTEKKECGSSCVDQKTGVACKSAEACKEGHVGEKK